MIGTRLVVSGTDLPAGTYGICDSFDQAPIVDGELLGRVVARQGRALEERTGGSTHNVVANELIAYDGFQKRDWHLEVQLQISTIWDGSKPSGRGGRFFGMKPTNMGSGRFMSLGELPDGPSSRDESRARADLGPVKRGLGGCFNSGTSPAGNRSAHHLLGRRFDALL